MEATYGRKSRVRTVSDESRDSYYGLPVIHKPHWKWLIIVYFFLGGISGMSYALAAIAQFLGGADERPIARAGKYISLATLIPCPILLILDLGRPERFHHMLRIFKLRSPMSVGTWILSVFGAFCGLSALVQAARDGLLGRENPLASSLAALPSRVVDTLGMPFGFLLAGYTGVLVAATAVPVWTKNYLLMGPMFLVSATSNATASIVLALSFSKRTKEDTLRRLERLDTLVLAGELATLLVARARLGKTVGRPLSEGTTGMVYRYGVLGVGIAAPLALMSRAAVFGKSSSRAVTALAASMVLAGGLMFRYVWVMAGRESADDPEATFELTASDEQAPAAE